MSSASSLSKEFFELIKAIGESKSKQEEDRIVSSEVVALKNFMSEKPVSGTTWARKMKEFILRLIYVEMLGHDASWGYVIAVQQTASQDLAQKRAAYLACALFLSPDHEFRFMLVNQMQRDLASANILEISAALVAICKIVTPDMIPAVLPKVTELLAHQQNLIRKKAIMVLHRFFQLDPSSIQSLFPQIKAMLRDRDPSVMGAALCLIHELIKSNPQENLVLIDQLVSILKQITEHRLPRDFDYHRMPAPWLQIKLLQMLASLGQNEKRGSESMYEVIAECMRRADTGTNIGYAIVYECVKTVTQIWPDTSLLDAAAAAIAKFIVSDIYNLKSLGITGLASIVKDHPRYAAQHQLAVIECLEDPDETLKRKTLELLYRMTNPVNSQVVVAKLLHFLKEANDPFLKRDLIEKIIALAERFAPNNIWYIETIIKLFSIVEGKVDSLEDQKIQQNGAQNLLTLLSEGEDEDESSSRQMRRRACELLLGVIDAPHEEEEEEGKLRGEQGKVLYNVNDVLVKIAFWALGEYGYLLQTGNEEEEEGGEVWSLLEVLQILCDTMERSLPPLTRAYGITAIMKITSQVGHAPSFVVDLVKKFSNSSHSELHQRCTEFFELSNDFALFKKIFPVDAACEDFEDADYSHLEFFVDVLKAVEGTKEYDAKLYESVCAGKAGLGGNGDALNESTLNKSFGAGLRFDAYEAPSLNNSTFAMDSSSLYAPKSIDVSAISVSSTTTNAPTQVSFTPPVVVETNLNKVKPVWGPQGYVGNLSSPLPGANTNNNATITTPNAFSQQQQQQQQPPVNNFYPPVQREVEKAPPPPVYTPPAPRELTENEKLAKALFGGIEEMSSTSSSLRKKTSSGGGAAITKPLPPPPVEDNLLGDYLTEQKPQPSSSGGNSTNLLDIFSDSAPTPVVVAQSSSQPASFGGGLVKRELQPVKTMSTNVFGTLWPSHSSEEVVANHRIKSLVAFEQLVKVEMEKLVGCNCVEFIPPTSEAILIGAIGNDYVLLHCKSVDALHVNITVRSKSPAVTSTVAAAVRRSL